MSFDYAAIAKDADATIREFGASATLRRIASDSATYNPATGVATQPATSPQKCVAVVFAYPQKMIDGSLIRQGDSQAYVSTVGITAPIVGDQLDWQGTILTVMNVKPLAPAGVQVLYELQLR